MKKDDIPETIILDDKDGFKIVSAFSYHSKKSGIKINYGEGGAPNLLVNKKGISVEVFNPSRKYLDKEGKKVCLDNKGNRVVEDLSPKKNNNLNKTNNNLSSRIVDYFDTGSLILIGIFSFLTYISIYFYGLNDFLTMLITGGFGSVVLFTFVAVKFFEGEPYLVFFKKHFIALLIASLILTNFYFLMGGPEDIPCRINAFACE